MPAERTHDPELLQGLDDAQARLRAEQHEQTALSQEQARLKTRLELLEAELQRLHLQMQKLTAQEPQRSQSPPSAVQRRSGPPHPSLTSLLLLGASGLAFGAMDKPIMGSVLLVVAVALWVHQWMTGPR